MTTNFVGIVVMITVLQVALLGVLLLSIRMEGRLDRRSVRTLTALDIPRAQSQTQPSAAIYQVSSTAN